jgi:preprotein translocase subunit Sss1
MDGQLIGLVAVIMSLGIPLGAMYTYYRVRRLRTEERLAAIARGVSVPMEPELSQAARSRRAGILLVTGALGFIIAFGLIAQIEREPETWVAAAFGIIPLAVGSGYFLDWSLIRRDLHPSS